MATPAKFPLFVMGEVRTSPNAEHLSSRQSPMMLIGATRAVPVIAITTTSNEVRADLNQAAMGIGDARWNNAGRINNVGNMPATPLLAEKTMNGTDSATLTNIHTDGENSLASPRTLTIISTTDMRRAGP
ncbi:hypothetical protein StoSoilB22_31870 [Arthrobacter sp. StoSoilB22]|nr:hypothetical protein StoSoilB22_31870 [Arthrobacter sp. StoSoilB22]